MKNTKDSERLFENIEDMLDHDIEQLTYHEEGADEELDAPEFDMEGVFNNIMRVITQKKHHPIANVLKWTSAAIIVFMLGFSSYYLFLDSSVKHMKSMLQKVRSCSWFSLMAQRYFLILTLNLVTQIGFMADSGKLDSKVRDISRSPKIPDIHS